MSKEIIDQLRRPWRYNNPDLTTADAADALEAQAARIAELEAATSRLAKNNTDDIKLIDKLVAERDTLRSQMNPDWDVKAACIESVREHQRIAAELRAELQTLHEQEPVAYVVDGGKKNGALLHDWQYHNEIVVPKFMCKPLYLAAKPTVRELSDSEIDALAKAAGFSVEAGRIFANSEMGPAHALCTNATHKLARAVLAAARGEK